MGVTNSPRYVRARRVGRDPGRGGEAGEVGVEVEPRRLVEARDEVAVAGLGEERGVVDAEVGRRVAAGAGLHVGPVLDPELGVEGEVLVLGGLPRLEVVVGGPFGGGILPGGDVPQRGGEGHTSAAGRGLLRGADGPLDGREAGGGVADVGDLEPRDGADEHVDGEEDVQVGVPERDAPGDHAAEGDAAVEAIG